MKVKIERLDIYTHSSTVSFSFDSKITFIYGNIGVGKTTLLSLAIYCLGGDLVETPAVKDQFLSAGLSVRLGTDRYLFRREYKSARIFVSDEAGWIYSIDKKKVSQFLYDKAGIRSIYYERQGVDTPNQLTFKNYLWYSYLNQADIDSNFFYLGKDANEFYQTASLNALASLLGKNSFVNEDEKRLLAEKRKRFKKYDHGRVALNYVISEELMELMLEEYKHTDKASEKGKILGRAILNYNRFLGEHCELKRQISDIASHMPKGAEPEFEKNLHELGEIFKKSLISIGFPSISEADQVRYDERTLNPTITNEYTGTEYSFDFLGSGGKKTLFKICFLLAVHIKAEQIFSDRNRLPSLIIIDTPMKNISEREDKELFEHFYRYLLELSNGSLSKTQFIIIDKEKNDIISKENAHIISISKEHPLFPEFVDVNIRRRK